MPFSVREHGAYLRDSLYTFAENALVPIMLIENEKIGMFPVKWTGRCAFHL
jgi:hypothetical protein